MQKYAKYKITQFILGWYELWAKLTDKEKTRPYS